MDAECACDRCVSADVKAARGEDSTPSARALRAERDALRDERDRLRRVIERYGRCDEDCASITTDGVSSCDCGFEACLYPALGCVAWSDAARAALGDHDAKEGTA